MNNAVTRNATFIVDRVAPTVVISPANNTRNVEPRQVTFTFSEEMAASVSDPIALTPATAAPPGSWQSGSRLVFTRSGLEPYTVFTAATGPNVVDRAGNPVVAASNRFHTSALAPLNGTLVASNVWAYDVASDPDGLPMVVTVQQVSSTNYSLATASMNGTTAQFSGWGFQRTSMYAVRGYQAFAWHSVNADLTATPIRGAWEDHQEQLCLPNPPYTCNTVGWVARAHTIGSGAPVVESSGSFLPTGPINPADGTGQVGFFNGQTYVRTPNISHNLSLTPARVAPGPVRWNVVDAPVVSAGAASMGVASYTCSSYGFRTVQYNCFPVWSIAISDASPSASWVRTSTGLENLSFVTADNGCTLLSYPSASSGRRIARIDDNNSRVPCPGPGGCLYSLTTTSLTSPTADFVLGRGGGNTLLGAGTTASGVQLYRTEDCGGTWTPVGDAVPRAAQPKPALIGTRPGLFYVDAARALRVHVP